RRVGERLDHRRELGLQFSLGERRPRGVADVVQGLYDEGVISLEAQAPLRDAGDRPEGVDHFLLSPQELYQSAELRPLHLVVAREPDPHPDALSLLDYLPP